MGDVPQAQEVGPPKRFREDVGRVVCRTNAGDLEGLLLNKLPDRMEFDPDMLDGGVASLILREMGSRIVVAEQQGRFLGQEAEAVQELTQECCFVRGLVQGDIFCITQAICHNALFL
jgi:hypothetical protein